MSGKEPYLIRGEDGILVPNSAQKWESEPYIEPDEAIKTWWAGELRLACNERKFSNYSSHPCGNPAKHDPDANGNPTKCGHHSAAAKARRKAKQDERDRIRNENWERQRVSRALYSERTSIIESIAAGHNDPRALCQDWLDRREKLENAK